MTLKFILPSLVFLTFCGLSSPGQAGEAGDRSAALQQALNQYSGQPNPPASPSVSSTHPAPAPADPAPSVHKSSTPLAAAAPAAPPTAAALPTPVADALPEEDIPENEMIDVLELKDVDISDVLKLLSQKSGLNIIADQNVRGKITIYLKNVHLRDAMRIILDANNLAYKVDNGIVRVMPAKEFEQRYGYPFGNKIKTMVVPLAYASVADATAVLNQIKSSEGKIIADPQSNTLVLMDSPEKLRVMQKLLHNIDVPVETRVFNLVYAQAKTVAEKVTEALSKDTGHIKYDDRSNKIVVTDTPFKISQVAKMIKAFDVKEKQVLIEAKIIQVKLDKEDQFGINWEAIMQKYHGLDFKNSTTLPNTKQAGGGGAINIGALSDDQYTALLQALETVTSSTILSSPTITAINNQEAKILVGTSQPYVTSTTTTPSSGPATTAESVNFIDVGVKLYVTPTIHDDGFITMKIRPEVSSAPSADFLATSDGNSIPVVDTSQAETTVVVHDGVTIIIGGLIQDEKSEVSNAVPVLSDIPLLGAAFRSTDTHPVKSEIIIFLTPKIITGNVSVTGNHKIQTVANDLMFTHQVSTAR